MRQHWPTVMRNNTLSLKQHKHALKIFHVNYQPTKAAMESRDEIHGFKTVSNLANTVISKGRSHWCPESRKSEQAPLSTTKMTQQQRSVSFRGSGDHHRTSPHVDVWHQGSNAERVLDVGMPGWAVQGQCLCGWHRWWDSDNKKKGGRAGKGGGEGGRTDVTSLSHTHNPEIEAEAEEQPTTHHLTAAKSWQKEEWSEGFLHFNRVSHKCSQTKKEKKAKIK